MPSRMHRMLVDLIGRKMREMGYMPVAFDGKYYVAQGEEVHIPPIIGRHRPDVVGINLVSKALCIGEAKTADDLLSERSREQFLDFSNIVGATSRQKIELVIGIPRSQEGALLRALAELGLDQCPNVSYIVLPEELVEDE